MENGLTGCGKRIIILSGVVPVKTFENCGFVPRQHAFRSKSSDFEGEYCEFIEIHHEISEKKLDKPGGGSIVLY